MSATAATVLKKVGEFVITDPKLLKKALCIILVILIVIMMPIMAIIAILKGGIKFDTARLQEIVTERMSDEEKSKLKFVEDTMNNIENSMVNKGFLDEFNREGHTYENEITPCIMVLGKGSDDGVCVDTSGCSYARFSAYIPHARQIVEPIMAEQNIEAEEPGPIQSM